MRHRSSIALATVAALSLAVPAVADRSTKQQDPALTREYAKQYAKVRAQLGKRAPGRNIVRWGVVTGEDASNHEIAVSIRRLRAMVGVPSSTPTAAAAGGGGAGGELASIRACESGGNYSTNTGNGFYGAYQFDAATWKAAGGSTATADQASPAEQDRVAANWIASGHRGAWPNC